MPEPPPARVILCPLQIEADSLRRAGVTDPIHVTGPGGEALRQVLDREITASSPSAVIVLAGVAGGLSSQVASGAAYAVSRVVNRSGEVVGEHELAQGTPGRVLCGVDAPVTTPEAKQALHQSSGADLVDMEAHHFVEHCRRKGLPWAIVRGVSDGAEDALPQGCLDFIDGRGRPRYAAVIRSLACRPWQFPAFIRLARQTKRAMAAVADALG